MLNDLIDLLIEIPLSIFSRDNNLRRKFKKTPTAKILKAESNIKIIGIIQKNESLYSAPLTKRPCLGFDILVQRSTSDGVEDYIEDCKSVNFILKTDLGNVQIVAKNATIYLNKDYETSSGILKDPTKEIVKLLSIHKKSATSFGLNKSLLFKEGIIKQGDKISIYGKGKWITTKETKEKTFRMVPMKEAPLYIMNHEDCFKK